MAFTQRQLLEGVDSATCHIVVEDCGLVTFNSACMIGAAAEDAGLPCLPRAVNTLMATLVTSTASEVVQSLLCELDGPGQELLREDLLSRAWQSSHSVHPVRATYFLVGVAYWLRCPTLFSSLW